MNLLHYDGGYWPTRIESVHDEAVLTFIETHLQLEPLGARSDGYAVLSDTRIEASGAMALANAADDRWAALKTCDVERFGEAFRRSFDAQVAMFTHMADDGLGAVIAKHASGTLGWKLSGAGGRVP